MNSCDEEELIFNYIKKNDNTFFSKMKGLDLQDFLIFINHYYIKLRDNLGLNKNVTLGLEIEFENALRYEICKDIETLFPDKKWIVKTDCSLINGAEVNSPVLKDNDESWNNLNIICSIISKYASIGERAGAHVHVGTQVLGDEAQSWINFIKLWAVYENIIFRFAYGEFLNSRNKITKYAKPTSLEFFKCYEIIKKDNFSVDAVISLLSHDRNQAVNFMNVYKKNCDKYYNKNTIEFRCPNGTLDPVIWQNNVNLFVKMLEYAKSSDFNDDILEKRKNGFDNKYFNLKMYNEIFLDQALEFCDLIFNNNVDKVNFLRQYLKSLEICESDKYYARAKRFTK